MARTLSAGNAAHLAAIGQTPARLLRLDLKDGTTLAVTDHDQEIVFDLGDGAVAYTPFTGIVPGDLGQNVGFDADEMEVTGPITDDGLTTKIAFIGGRFDDATGWFFEIDWANPDGAIALLKCYVFSAEVEGDRFKLTLHSEKSRFAQEVGRTITAYCDADFGDTRCGYSPIVDAVTVTAVTSALSFTVSNPNDRDEAFFNGGTVRNWTGALAGHRPVEISQFESILPGEATITLWTELAEAPQVGDTLDLRQGCYDVATGESKTRTACMAIQGDAVQFRGFPDVPGTDQVLRYPNPAA